MLPLHQKEQILSTLEEILIATSFFWRDKILYTHGNELILHISCINETFIRNPKSYSFL